MPDVEELSEHRAWPFGSPEGDRTELGDPIKEFIAFRGGRFRSGLGLDPADRKARVIVGRKGAGKTLYLRRLQAAARSEHAIYADEWRTSLFRNDYVLRMASWYRDDATTVERWEEVWRCAILRSLVSHLVGSDELASDLTPQHDTQLRTRYAELVPAYTDPETIYAQVSEIIERARHRDGLDRYLQDRRWDSLERVLGEVLKDTKPVCFYLDALDEKFEHAPRQWLLCQLGLFKTVMNLLRHAGLGGRLHVVIGVRDIVFSSTQMTENATKFVETQAIRTLNWDRPAIEYFLARKLDRLGTEHRMEPAADHNVERWLGRRRIYNEAREQEEELKDYLLRHTRLIPRDIVILGNMLCGLIDQARYEGQPFLTEHAIRDTVGLASRRFGQEELFIVANHLTAEAMPPDATARGYADIYTGEHRETQAFPQSVADQLGDAIGMIEHDRFDRDALFELAEAARRVIETRADPVDVLWQHGLLGYIEGDSILSGRVVFYSAAREDRLRLPRNRRGYAFHAIMVDTIDGLSGLGQPVHPY